MNRLHQAIKEAAGRPLLGAALYSYDPIFLEIAAHLGFQVIWIEMEHAPISFSEAADLCRMGEQSASQSSGARQGPGVARLLHHHPSRLGSAPYR